MVTGLYAWVRVCVRGEAPTEGLEGGDHKAPWVTHLRYTLPRRKCGVELLLPFSSCPRFGAPHDGRRQATINSIRMTPAHPHNQPTSSLPPSLTRPIQ